MCLFQFILFSSFFVGGEETISLCLLLLCHFPIISESCLVEFNLANAATYWEVNVIDLGLSSLNKKL